MIKWLILLFDTKGRKQKRINDSYKIGYDYAAGSLLRGEKTPRDLETEAITSSTFDEDKEMRSFDMGIVDAVDKLVSFGVVHDNRAYGTGWASGEGNQKARQEADVFKGVRGAARLRLVQAEQLGDE
jgi:hypothetical protein